MTLWYTNKDNGGCFYYTKPPGLYFIDTYIILRKLELSKLCSGKPANIYVFATSTVFLSEDINIYGETTLTIISPKIVVVGKSNISMLGEHNFDTYTDPKEQAILELSKTAEEVHKALVSMVGSGYKGVYKAAQVEPKRSYPGHSGGNLLMVAGEGSIVNLRIKSKGGMGGIGGMPGVIGVYVLENSQGCGVNCYAYIGETYSPGKYKLRYSRKSFNGTVDLTRTIGYYKTQTHSLINQFNFDSVTNFWRKIDASSDLQKFSNTLEFARELLSIVSESHSGNSFSKRILSARYSSLIRRVETFSESPFPTRQVAELDCGKYSPESSPHTNPCTTKFKKTLNESTIENKRALFTIYTAAAAQIKFLKESVDNNVVIDISSFLDLSIKALEDAKKSNELKSISEGMNNALNEYKGGIEKEIQHASSFIKASLKPDIENYMRKLKTKVDEVLKVIKGKEALTKNISLTLTSNNRQVIENMKLKQVTNSLNLFGNFLGAAPLIAENLNGLAQNIIPGVGGSLKGLTSGLVSGAVGTLKNIFGRKKRTAVRREISNLSANIEKIRAEAKTSHTSLLAYLRELPDEVEINQFFEELMGHLPNLPNGTESYEVLKKDVEKAVAAYRQEIKKDIPDYAKSATIKSEINDLVIRLSREMPEEKSGRGFWGALENIGKAFAKPFVKAYETVTKTVSKAFKGDFSGAFSTAVSGASSTVLGGLPSMALGLGSSALSAIFPSNMGEIIRLKNAAAQNEKDVQIAIKELNELNILYYNMKNTVTGVVVPMLSRINLMFSVDMQNLSSVEASLSGWEIGKAIRTLRTQLQTILSSVQIQGHLLFEVNHLVGELEAAMHTVTGVQEKAASLRGNQKLANLIFELSSPQFVNAKITGELGKLITEIEVKIKTGSAFWFYNLCKAAFIQHVFPFADLYGEELYLPADLIRNDSSFAIDQAVKKLGNQKTHVEKQKATISRLDKYQYFGTFEEDSEILGPFYKWNSPENKEKVDNLLSGKEIYLDANVVESDDGVDAIKFREIHLLFNFISDNETLVKNFNSILNACKIRLTHSGNGYYRFQGKYYQISSTPVDIEYSFKTNKKDGTPSVKNWVYEKLAKGDFTLSPYTLWKVSLIATKKVFDKLKPFLGAQVNLILVGEGTYVDPQEIVGEDFRVGKYYEFSGNMEGLASAELKPDALQNGRMVGFCRKEGRSSSQGRRVQFGKKGRQFSASVQNGRRLNFGRNGRRFRG